MRNTFLIVFMILSSVCSAQPTVTPEENVTLFVDGGIDGTGDLTSVTTREAEPVTIGNVYLFPSWINAAQLYTSTKKEFSIDNLNYNVKTDNFEIKMTKDSVFILKPSYLEQITLQGKTFKYYTTSSTSKGFYEILYHGQNLSLLKKYYVRLIQGKLNPLDGSISPNTYYVSHKYFIKRDTIFSKLDNKKKSLLAAFPKKEKQLKSFIKKNKLSPKKEEHFIRIFKYIN